MLTYFLLDVYEWKLKVTRDELLRSQVTDKWPNNVRDDLLDVLVIIFGPNALLFAFGIIISYNNIQRHLLNCQYLFQSAKCTSKPVTSPKLSSEGLGTYNLQEQNESQ